MPHDPQVDIDLAKKEPIAHNDVLSPYAELVSIQDSDQAAESLDSKEFITDETEELYPCGKLEGTVFADPRLAEFYNPPDTYESKHRFKPGTRWSKSEDRRLMFKVDLFIITMACVMFSCLNFDRGNIQRATSTNEFEDMVLGGKTDDYNTGQSIFYVTFLFAEMPSQLISKAVGVDIWVPIQMILWSIVTICQAWMRGRSQFFALRALLGLFEGGFIPDLILYLSYFYTGKELTTRLTYFWITLIATDVVNSFVSTGFLKITALGLHGWQWLFIIEGAFTGLIGLLALLWMPASPTQTKGSIRGKGWFTEREETLIVTRVLLDDPTKSDMHNRQAVDWYHFYRCITDWDLYPLYIIALSQYTGSNVITQYMSIVLHQNLGFSTEKTNLLNIPPNALRIVTTLIQSYLVNIFNERSLTTLFNNIWQFPIFIALATIPTSTNNWAKYALVLLAMAQPYPHPALVSWVSQNSGSVATRSIASSLYNMFTQMGSIYSAHIYRQNDKASGYHKGNWAIFGTIVFNTLLHLFTKYYYIRKNKQKQDKWDAMTAEEQAEYLATTRDFGTKRLNFRFAH